MGDNKNLPPTDSSGLTLRSAIPGRERWEVKALKGRPESAKSLEKALLRHPRVQHAAANAVSARVLVIYTHESPKLNVGRLIADNLAEALAQPPASPDATDEESAALTRILKLSIPDRRRLLKPSLLSVATFATHMLQSMFFVSTINAARGTGMGAQRAGTASRLPAGIAFSVVLSGLDGWTRYHRRRMWHELNHEVQQELQARLLERVENQDLKFFDAKGTSNLINLITRDTAHIGKFVEEAGNQIISNGLMITATGAMLATASPKLALVSALPLLFLLLPPRIFGRLAAERYARQSRLTSRYGQMLEENFSGIVDVKSFSAEELEVRRLHAAGGQLAEASAQATNTSVGQAALAKGIFTTGFCLTSLYGGHLAASGKISQVAYLKALYMFPDLIEAVSGIDELTERYHAAKTSAARLSSILDERPAIRSGPKRLPKSSVQGEVVFENVTFGYDPEVTVLRNVSFRVQPGETLAVVGRTGSGKSTLVRLLVRFYDVNSGRILIDGKDIRELNLQDLRSAIGLVNQEVYLFHGSVRDNVLYGKPGASRDELANVMRDAEASELLESMRKAEVGARGRMLSGGERQRVAIARALLKDAPILALDEVTSHLDYETEAAVNRSVRQRTSGKCLIVVAHRLSTIRDADRILVLDQGRICEEGRHDDLVSRAGIYASLWRLQNGGHDSDGPAVAL